MNNEENKKISLDELLEILLDPNISEEDYQLYHDYYIQYYIKNQEESK